MILPLYRRALIAFGIVVLALGVLVGRAEMARRGGEEIVLETRPIDPRDVFFGHYAILSYAIGGENHYAQTDDALRATIEAGEAPGRDAFVAFEKGGRFHTPAVVSLDRGALPQGMPVLRAEIGQARADRCAVGVGESDEARCRGILRLRYELPSRYYADPKTALALQDRSREARSLEADRRRWAQCHGPDAMTDPDTRAGQRCDRVPADDPAVGSASEAPFGIILSAGARGDAVIRGLILDDRRVIDSLSGPRLTLSRTEE